MRTPNHVTDEQINEIYESGWPRIALAMCARNFVQAYESLELQRDERARYTGYDPRNHTGENL